MCELSECTCSKDYNLPMCLEDDDGGIWIECDFCGNKTKKYKREIDAILKWEEFQHKRGVSPNAGIRGEKGACNG